MSFHFLLHLIAIYFHLSLHRYGGRPLTSKPRPSKLTKDSADVVNPRAEWGVCLLVGIMCIICAGTTVSAYSHLGRITVVIFLISCIYMVRRHPYILWHSVCLTKYVAYMLCQWQLLYYHSQTFFFFSFCKEVLRRGRNCGKREWDGRLAGGKRGAWVKVNKKRGTIMLTAGLTMLLASLTCIAQLFSGALSASVGCESWLYL